MIYLSFILWHTAGNLLFNFFYVTADRWRTRLRRVPQPSACRIIADGCGADGYPCLAWTHVDSDTVVTVHRPPFNVAMGILQ